MRFVVQANMEFEFECFFFYDSNVKIIEFRMFLIANKYQNEKQIDLSKKHIVFLNSIDDFYSIRQSQ